MGLEIAAALLACAVYWWWQMGRARDPRSQALDAFNRAHSAVERDWSENRSQRDAAAKQDPLYASSASREAAEVIMKAYRTCAKSDGMQYLSKRILDGSLTPIEVAQRAFLVGFAISAHRFANMFDEIRANQPLPPEVSQELFK